MIVRTTGRPRSLEADEAILDAATGLFIELGYDGLTVEGVAARAGVGKTTIYRRYPSKPDLVMAAAERMCAQKGPVADTGSLRGDLLATAKSYRRLLTSTDAGRAIPATVAAAARNEELSRAHREFIARRRATSATIVHRAIDRGEVPADVDVDLVVDLVSAPLFYRVLVSGDPVDDAFIERLVSTVLRAAIASSGEGA